MTKVYIAAGAFHNYVRAMFNSEGYELVSLNADPDVLVLIGGDDINPRLYGEKPLASTYFNDRTDDYDIALYHQFEEKPKIGICRGGQLMNVLAGGGMWQDVEGHNRTHLSYDVKTKETIKFSSMHHQAMISPVEALHLSFSAQTTVCRSPFAKIEAEILEASYIPRTKALCFQPHPEVGPPECVSYFFRLIHEHLGV